MTKVKIIPKSKRAKERVKAHGEVMNLVMVTADRFLVESLGNTWHDETWAGWFKTEEAKYEIQE